MPPRRTSVRAAPCATKLTLAPPRAAAEYVSLYVYKLLSELVDAQFCAFYRGFHNVCGGDALKVGQFHSHCATACARCRGCANPLATRPAAVPPRGAGAAGVRES